MTARYGVRRFCDKGARPDCFEAYDTTTGECQSFGCYRYEAEQTAQWLNAHDRHGGKCDSPAAWGTCPHFPARTRNRLLAERAAMRAAERDREAFMAELDALGESWLSALGGDS